MPRIGYTPGRTGGRPRNGRRAPRLSDMWGTRATFTGIRAQAEQPVASDSDNSLPARSAVAERSIGGVVTVRLFARHRRGTSGDVDASRDRTHRNRVTSVPA